MNQEISHLNQEISHLNHEISHLNQEISHLEKEMVHLTEHLERYREREKEMAVTLDNTARRASYMEERLLKVRVRVLG